MRIYHTPAPHPSPYLQLQPADLVPGYTTTGYLIQSAAPHLTCSSSLPTLSLGTVALLTACVDSVITTNFLI
jgi:hypothetical protein